MQLKSWMDELMNEWILTIDVVLLQLLLLLLTILLAVFIEIGDLVALYLFLVRLPRPFVDDRHVLRWFNLDRWSMMHVWNDVVFDVTVGRRWSSRFRVSELWLRRNIWRVWVGVCQRVEINVFGLMVRLHVAVAWLKVVLLVEVLRHNLLLNASRRWMRAVVNLMIVVHHVNRCWRLNPRSILLGLSNWNIERCFTPWIKMTLKILWK